MSAPPTPAVPRGRHAYPGRRRLRQSPCITWGSAAGTAGVDLTGTIPWLDPPTQPPLAPTPSPAPSRPTDARACTATDVTARLDGRNGAGGHAITYVQFRNTSTSPCVLSDYPHVTVTEPGLPTVAGSNGSFFPPGDPGTRSRLAGGSVQRHRLIEISLRGDGAEVNTRRAPNHPSLELDHVVTSTVVRPQIRDVAVDEDWTRQTDAATGLADHAPIRFRLRRE